ncbi:unnamed protein product [Peronospora farinosa]|uniref:Uncharacterized protein n=1 Tax=Peronospora farinosa TaxID=134698 RepID=A0AAV0TBJ7_9STRA|nr:unnamed protein product [Peronospora farinosa]CAH0489685.1 unnamed protein product [Peronospora farinosa]CAI5716410.1 unnamed protein product [Peronospora farinosa]CAI5716420.1 unnamed protein product [Peronospora farinosa]
MLKSNDHTATVKREFALLENVLNQTADDAARCLKLLKKNLSDYDNRHGNYFINTATSFMRNDMRTAKDMAFDLKHVAHQINKNPEPSELNIDSARNMMDVVAKSMDVLSTTARNYDEKNGRSKGVKGVIDNAVGKNDKEKHEKEGGLFGKGHRNIDEKHVGHLGTMDANHDGGLLGKTDGHHHHGGGVFSSSDTVEQLVKTTLHDNFNVSALSHQITNAEKSLSPSPSFVERVKEVVHEVKDKLKGEKSSPTHGGHHGNKHVVAP